MRREEGRQERDMYFRVFVFVRGWDILGEGGWMKEDKEGKRKAGMQGRKDGGSRRVGYHPK